MEASVKIMKLLDSKFYNRIIKLSDNSERELMELTELRNSANYLNCKIKIFLKFYFKPYY